MRLSWGEDDEGEVKGNAGVILCEWEAAKLFAGSSCKPAGTEPKSPPMADPSSLEEKDPCTVWVGFPK